MPIRVRANVQRMQPYSPGKPVEEVKRELGLDRVIKLASNENPFGPSPKALAAIESAAKNLHIYPDGSAHALRQAVAGKHRVPEKNLVFGNGSDELIHLLGLILLEGGENEVVLGNPTFTRYHAAAHLSSAKLVEVPLDSGFKHDLPAMAKAITERTRMVFLANPNNPTGTIVRKAEVDAFLRDLPEGVPLVLDEAYYEFAADEPGFPNSRDYVLDGKPVIGLRTFSKAYGLAGIRVGFGFAPTEVIDAMERAREPFNVNSLAQAAAIGALDDDEHVRKTVDSNREGLARLEQALRAVGGKTYPSFANFVLADLGRPARPVFDELLKRGVIVRPGDVLGAPTCLRVSVGTPEELDAFCQALHQILRPAEVSA